MNGSKWRGDRLAVALLLLLPTLFFSDVLLGFGRSVIYGLSILRVLVRYKLHKKGLHHSRIFR